MGTTVSLVRAERSAESLAGAIDRALRLIDFRFPSSANLVVIKPNLCYYWDAGTGYTTDPLLVGAIVDLIRERCGRDVDIAVGEADASAMRTKYSFKVLGYERLAAKLGVRLLNLSEDVQVDKSSEVNGKRLSFKVPEILLKADLVINMPKLKIMRATKITCAMKNIFGSMGFARKIAFHKHLDEAIVGMNMIIRPHLTVVDGLVGLGKFPRKLNLLIAGKDSFSVDWVASEIMGYKPMSVKFLKIAVKERIGDPSEIVTAGDKLDDFAKLFPKEGFLATKHLWGIQFWLLRTYQKLSGDIIPPILEEE